MEPGSNSMVYPSGSERATYSLPRLLPAPDLFSMMTCWCHITDSLSASARATMSVGPPAATGTMTRTGLLGYVPFGVCARPAPRRRLVVTAWAAESAIKSRRPSISVNPRCLDTRILSLGQRRHHRRIVEGMHALPPKADIQAAIGYYCRWARVLKFVEHHL